MRDIFLYDYDIVRGPSLSHKVGLGGINNGVKPEVGLGGINNRVKRGFHFVNNDLSNELVYRVAQSNGSEILNRNNIDLLRNQIKVGGIHEGGMDDLAKTSWQKRVVTAPTQFQYFWKHKGYNPSDPGALRGQKISGL